MWTAFVVISLLAFAAILTIVMVLVVPLPGTHHPLPTAVETPVVDVKHSIEPPDWVKPSVYRSRSTQELRLTDYPTDNFAAVNAEIKAGGWR